MRKVNNFEKKIKGRSPKKWANSERMFDFDHITEINSFWQF